MSTGVTPQMNSNTERWVCILLLFIIIILISSPDSWAQHCNYATLLAGRGINNLWYSIILPMGPSFVSMLVFVVRGIVYLCGLCVYFPGFYFATISGLSLSFSLPRCGSLYWVEVFRNGVTLWPFVRANLAYCLLFRVIFCCSISPHRFQSTVYKCTHSQKEAQSPMGFVCLLSGLDVSISTLE